MDKMDVFREWYEWSGGIASHDLAMSGVRFPQGLTVDLGEVQPAGEDLGEALASMLGVSPEELIIATSETGLIRTLVDELAADGVVLMENPSFRPLVEMLEIAGTFVQPIERHGPEYTLHPEDVISAWLPGTRLVILSSPHNPSGNRLDIEHLIAIADFCSRNGALLILEETHAVLERDHIWGHDIHPAVISLVRPAHLWSQPDPLCWLMADAEVIHDLRDVIGEADPWSLQLTAALVADQGHRLEHARNQVAINRFAFEARFGSSPYFESVLHTDAPYVLIRPTWTVNTRRRDLIQELLQHITEQSGVRLFPGRFFGEPGSFRLSFAETIGRFREGIDLLHEQLETLRPNKSRRLLL